ncbi:flagellin [Rhizobiaceae bacterium BDR2-2]|uniref:Flagellin n=1 Tax=Ectorhizobium quercum TaxID=2965071 RepID=A0AAE3MX82_9HYPH|nr:flagellin [Ectorhizobium quercum]MCX8996116.1 flagellin [Ectorhizobium quercum]MCX8998845.1 flagellin [Ectorhizobium quercum]
MSYVIMTSNSVSAALQTLLSSNTQLTEAQKRLSSGMQISDAKDNPGYWSVANALTSDESTLTSVGDALNLSEAMIDTAYTAITTVLDQLSTLRATLVTATDSSVDRSLTNVAVEGAKKAIETAVISAQFSGTNWLTNGDATLAGTNSIVTSFQRTGNGSVKLQTQGIPAADTILIDTYDPGRGLLTRSIDANELNPDGTATPRNYYLLAPGDGGTEIAVTDTTTEDEIADMIDVIESMMADISEIASRFGDMLNRVASQSSFAQSMAQTLKTSVSRLIDANMEEVSVRVTAAETQASLAAETVSLVNTNMKKLLLVFG